MNKHLFNTSIRILHTSRKNLLSIGETVYQYGEDSAWTMRRCTLATSVQQSCRECRFYIEKAGRQRWPRRGTCPASADM